MGSKKKNDNKSSVSANAEDNLRFIEEVIDRLKCISMERRAFLEEQMNIIKTRYTNPYLNLALIGNFSSGKSTFINSWIGMPLLKTAMKAVTAVPTRIYRVKESALPIVDAEDLGGIYYPLNTPRLRAQFVNKFGLPQPESITDFLYNVSSADKLSDKMKNISIGIDSERLADDICIIDTPGIDAGEERAYSHRLQTQNTLREQADATIILFPANRVLTADFEIFLNENASHFLEDAVFVISMCDRVETSELEEILIYIEKCLKKDFNLKKPLIYPVAAKYVLSDETNQKAEEWKASFWNMQCQVSDYLRKQRTRILKKQLNRLFTELLTELEKDLQTNKQLLQNDMNILEKNNPESLKQKLELLFNKTDLQFQKQVISTQGIVNNRLHEEIQLAKNKLCSRIDNCDEVYGDGYSSIAYVKRNDMKKIPGEISEHIKFRLKNDIQPLIKIIDEHQKECDDLFKQYQYQLKGQKYQGEKVTAAIDMTMGEINVYHEYESQKNGFESAIEISGVIFAIPLVISFVILDEIFDWNITEAAERGLDKVGNWLRKQWEPNHSSVKNKNKIAICSALDKAESENTKAFYKSVEETISSLKSQFNGGRKKFITAYDPIFCQKESEFQSEKARLESLIRKDDETADRISKRLLNLK